MIVKIRVPNDLLAVLHLGFAPEARFPPLCLSRGPVAPDVPPIRRIYG